MGQISKQSVGRQNFFDKQVFMPEWRSQMMGENEEKLLEVLEVAGYKEGEDYLRQYPFGDRYVADVAFLTEEFIIEIDGNEHKSKKKRRSDLERDTFFISNGWIVLRISEENLIKNMSFYKHLVQEIVKDRRSSYKEGALRGAKPKDFI